MLVKLYLWGIARACSRPKTVLIPYFKAVSCELVDLCDSIQANLPLAFLASVRAVKTYVLKPFNSPLVCAIGLYNNIHNFIAGFIDTILYPYSMGHLWFDLWRSVEAFVDGSYVYIECLLDGVCYSMEFLLRDAPAYFWGLVVYAPVCLLVDTPFCFVDVLTSTPECSMRFYTPNL